MHPLHKAIGEVLTAERLEGCEILLDPSCGGDRTVALYCTKARSPETKYCTVDALVIKAGRIKAVIDVDESTATPSHIAGKFFATALSRFHIPKHKQHAPVPMDGEMAYLQVLYAKDVSEKRTKMEQWRYMEESIRASLPIPRSRMGHFRVFYGTSDDFMFGAEKDAFFRYLKGRL